MTLQQVVDTYERHAAASAKQRRSEPDDTRHMERMAAIETLIMGRKPMTTPELDAWAVDQPEHVRDWLRSRHLI